MPNLNGLKIFFVAGFGPLVRDPAVSKAFYVGTLGLPLEPMPNDSDTITAKASAVRLIQFPR